MKLKLNYLALAAAVAIAVAAPAFADPEPAVTDPFGKAVKDPFDKCVLAVGGTVLPECGPMVQKKRSELKLSGDTNFDFNKDTLKPAGKAELDKVVADMKQAKQVDAVIVVGHTDSVGSDAYNQRLSERRAATVKNYLAAKGVPAGIIQASGRGESQPVADNATAAGRAQNRRVEITVEVTQ